MLLHCIDEIHFAAVMLKVAVLELEICHCHYHTLFQRNIAWQRFL